MKICQVFVHKSLQILIPNKKKKKKKYLNYHVEHDTFYSVTMPLFLFSYWQIWCNSFSEVIISNRADMTAQELVLSLGIYRLPCLFTIFMKIYFKNLLSLRLQYSKLRACALHGSCWGHWSYLFPYILSSLCSVRSLWPVNRLHVHSLKSLNRTALLKRF